MMLAVDAGNSRVKWGLRDDGRWRERGALEHRHIAELGARLPRQLTRVMIANVAGGAVAAALVAALETRCAGIEWLRSEATRAGVRNGYRDPAQLGVDRWAALIGAWQRVRGSCLVVMAGTATTVDVLDASGLFRGGVILPGLRLMREALAANTALLGLPEGGFAALPDNTADAIVSGCLQAQLGAIERMHAHLDAAAPVLLSGGAASALSALVRLPTRTEDNLVLEGLAAVLEV